MRRPINDENRIKIVRLHLDHGWTIKSLAEKYGFSPSTIGRWVIRYRNGKMPGDQTDAMGIKGTKD